jgi:hypothetical protein
MLRTPSGMVAAGRFGDAATVGAIRTTAAALREVMRKGAVASARCGVDCRCGP